MTKPNPEIARKSISLSSAVAQWADELAYKKGFGSNFSAYIADLIRHDYHHAANVRAAAEASHLNTLTKNQAVDELVAAVQKAVRRTTARRK